MKAVILAAGLGTRLRSFTNDKPKALVKVGDKTMLELAIRFLQKNGINEFVINVHHFGQLVLDYLADNENFGAIIHISDEREQLLDTGGGLVVMEKWLKDEPFIIYNVDILTKIDLQEMVKFHKKSKSIVTLAVSNRKSSRYFIFDNSQKLCGWKNINTGEVKSISPRIKESQDLAFSGIHVLNPEIFKYKPAEKAFSIIDWYLELAKNQRLSGFDHTGIFWLDLGKIPALEEAEKLLKSKFFTT